MIVAVALAAFGVVFGVVYDVRHYFEHRAARATPSNPSDPPETRT